MERKKKTFTLRFYLLIPHSKLSLSLLLPALLPLPCAFRLRPYLSHDISGASKTVVEFVFSNVESTAIGIEEVDDTTIKTLLTTSPAPLFQSLTVIEEADDVAIEFDFAFAPPPLFIAVCGKDETDFVACISSAPDKHYFPSSATAVPILDFSPLIFIAVRPFVVRGEERIVGK